MRRRLLPAVLWLYDHHWKRLARCVQRPAHPRRSWDGLGFGLVLVYNARACLSRHAPAGFTLEKVLAPAGWREAWTVAMSLDAAAVTPFCIRLFGNRPGRGEPEAGGPPPGHELICPSDWKV